MNYLLRLGAVCRPGVTGVSLASVACECRSYGRGSMQALVAALRGSEALGRPREVPRGGAESQRRSTAD